MCYFKNWAIVIPMANEEKDFIPFTDVLTSVINALQPGKVYFIIDKISMDDTLQLCQELSDKDSRFCTIWAPDSKNVVDAYLKGLRVAYEAGHEIIIEMDAGLSHDPKEIPVFLRALNEGNECVFGSRIINGGSMSDSVITRRVLSRVGTLLSNCLLGTKLHDMTSGFQGFHQDIVGKILKYNLKAKAHFYQTELRYLLRKRRFSEVPIHYRAPSPRVSITAITNSLKTLLYYFYFRITFKSKSL